MLIDEHSARGSRRVSIICLILLKQVLIVLVCTETARSPLLFILHVRILGNHSIYLLFLSLDQLLCVYSSLHTRIPVHIILTDSRLPRASIHLVTGRLASERFVEVIPSFL